MTRIAHLSPLPPEASGIADYSVEVLASLRQRFDIDLFSGGGPGPLPAGLAGLTTRQYGDFPGAHERRPYDAVIYHIGNNPTYHREIYRHLQRVPGIVVLHEYMLHNLMRDLGDIDEYFETMRYCYGRRAAAIARRLSQLHEPADAWSYPLFEPVIDASLGVIVHSESARRRVRRSRPDARIGVVPLPVSRDQMPTVTNESRRALRRTLGVPDDALVIATFGHMTPAKRIDVAAKAFARLRQSHPDVVFVLAGEISPHLSDARALLEGPHRDRVIVTNRLPLDVLLQTMELADIAINLRHPNGGETSAVCVRLLGLGKPVIVSTGGWFSDIPEGCCAPIRPDRFEEDELTAVLQALAGNSELRRKMGAAAAQWAHEHHQLERTVDGYEAMINDVIRDQPRVNAPVPPLAPYTPGDMAIDLAADVAAAAAELGIGEQDEHVLPILADTLVELGVTSAAQGTFDAAMDASRRRRSRDTKRAGR